MLALLILLVRLGIIFFNLSGLVVVPIDAWQNWRFVRAPVWRYLHILSLAVVVVQAVLGRACFLTICQDELTGGSDENQPLIARTIDAMIYWSIPILVIAVGYILIFAYAFALLWFVPPRRIGRGR